MKVSLVHVHVKKEFVANFIRATEENHLNSVREAGNFRFDILQDETDPTKFILYEIFRDDEAVAAHKEQAHYFKWRDTVEAWLETPRHSAKYRLLFPGKG